MSGVRDRCTGNAVSRSQGERGLGLACASWPHAVCERFLGSLRRECLDHFVILNERHVHRLVKEYKVYFNRARPHQGIKQRVPCRTERLDAPPITATLSSRPVLNGLHHDYSWLAASSPEQNRAQSSIRHGFTVQIATSPALTLLEPARLSMPHVIKWSPRTL